ncbi:aldose 1-epimerase-like [Nasonia vitripennis]|uniref:Galactose mutarotase n=1 Tax=Nasonia vitripennis TaxID=7425 RepID=A0A7M7GFB2_NASVI|nr:aldose 1-epimerase-like [Nasonia vitripennis]
MVAAEVNVPRVRMDGFGFLPDDSREIVRRFTITNKNNARVRLISLGAGIQSITIPSNTGDDADVVLGFDNVAGYLKNRYIGRIVDQISNPQGTIGDPSSSKISGCSFDISNWDSYILGERVVMTHVSRGGSFGDLLTQVTYSWTDEQKLHVEISAVTTKPRCVDIGLCSVFNLAGHGMGPEELRKHIVTVNADRWTPICIKSRLPTGCIEDVQKTIYDLRCPTWLSSKRLRKVPGGGFNHNFCINSPSDRWCYRFHARLQHPESGRFLEVYSNHPAMRVYTANDLPDLEKVWPPDLDDEGMNANVIRESRDKIIGKDGLPYKRHGGVALIPQGYPCALNHANFPLNILHPGKVYVHKMTYDFGDLNQ